MLLQVGSVTQFNDFSLLQTTSLTTFYRCLSPLFFLFLLFPLPPFLSFSITYWWLTLRSVDLLQHVHDAFWTAWSGSLRHWIGVAALSHNWLFHLWTSGSEFGVALSFRAIG